MPAAEQFRIKNDPDFRSRLGKGPRYPFNQLVNEGDYFEVPLANTSISSAAYSWSKGHKVKLSVATMGDVRRVYLVKAAQGKEGE